MDTSLDKQVGGHLCGAASTKGCGEQNQDRFRITPDGILLLDGMGGHAAGEVYAELGAWKGEQLLGAGLTASDVLDGASHVAQRVEGALHDHGGAAACAVRFQDDGGYDIACRGDVRAYLIDDEGARPLTCPDTDPAGRLTCYLGSSGTPRPQGCCVSVAAEETAGKTLLVASDGVWRYLPLRECVEANRRCPNPHDAACAIVDLALKCATPDDATAVVCRPANAADDAE